MKKWQNENEENVRLAEIYAKHTRKRHRPGVLLTAGPFTKSRAAGESAGHANAARAADGDTALRIKMDHR